MEDQHIIALYHQRNPIAIKETHQKYGKYLSTVAYNILASREDSEECVNDTYLDTWNCIPPHRPQYFKAFLSKITRRISIDRLRRKTADKRQGQEYALSLEELSSVVSGQEMPEDALEKARLKDCINSFLCALPQKQAAIFLCRYFYFLPVKEIARRHSLTENHTKSILFRLRNKLKEYLIKEDFSL